MPIGLAGKVALGGMAGAGAAGILAPEVLFGISYLEGDPDKIRKAADVLDEVADTIDKHFKAANEAAEAVWAKTSDPGVAAFRKFWTQRYGPAVCELSLRHRRTANACRAYADTVENANYALKVLCWILTVDMMYTIGYQVLTWKLAQLMLKRQALQLKVVRERAVSLLLPTFMYWVADSLTYALGEVALPLAINGMAGIKTDLSGNDVQSMGYNLKTYGEHFTANMVFNSVIDGGSALMTKVPGLRNVATDVELPNGVKLNTATAVPRLTASTAYSMTLDTVRGDNPLPGAEQGLTEQEMYQKFIVHGTRSLIPKL